MARHDRHRPTRTVAAPFLLLALALVVAGCQPLIDQVRETIGLGGGPDTVLLEPFGDPGPDPFTASVAIDAPETATFAEQGRPDPPEDVDAPDPAAALTQTDGHYEIDGGTPGLYGGTGEMGSCDVDQLIAFLSADPSKAAAFAQVVGVTPEGLPAYLNGLTPVVLGADTRVRNHGYANGQPTPREVVLQRGTAVLVDSAGVPRVRCACGNPLAAPTIRPDPTFRGTAWPAFNPGGVLVVRPATVLVTTFIIVDLRTGVIIEREVASRGDRDRPVGPEDPEQAPPEQDPPAPDPEVPEEDEPPDLPPSGDPVDVWEIGGACLGAWRLPDDRIYCAAVPLAAGESCPDTVDVTRMDPPWHEWCDVVDDSVYPDT